MLFDFLSGFESPNTGSLSHSEYSVFGLSLALKEVAKKLEKLEERMINGEIEHSTYKKWFPKLSGDKSEIQEEIKSLEEDQNDKWNTLVRLFPHLMNMKLMYYKEDLRQKHLFLKLVFKELSLILRANIEHPQ